MMACHTLPKHYNGGAVDTAVVRNGIEAVFQCEGEGGTVAEGFFLREGAVEPAAPGVECVCHVEDQDGFASAIVILGMRGEGQGRVDAICVLHTDGRGAEVGTLRGR